jgi:hypothetical protein
MAKPQPKIYRILEFIPGILVWTTFIVAISLSFIRPLWVIYFIIAFTLYWVVRINYLNIYAVLSWFKFKKEISINWLEKIKTFPNWDQYYHLVFLPTYKEGLEIVDDALKHLTESSYPAAKMIVVLGGEEGDKQHFLEIAQVVEKKYKHAFHKFLITVHPRGLEGEIPGKGSNEVWMGQAILKYIDQEKIPYESIIVSSFDVDTCAGVDYFSYLTYKYMTVPDPTHTSFQPVALYHNNIWDAPAFVRLPANTTTFWLLTELVRPERAFTFASHSMSFKALVEVGFWEKDIVTEDSRIFLQCFIHYQGNYRVEPMFTSISMDTVLDSTFWKSFKNQYIQIRRWGWSIEHFPYMIWNFFLRKDKHIPFLKKIKYVWNLTEGSYTWATAPVLLLVLGQLPLMMANRANEATVVAQNAPYVLQNLMTFGMFGLILFAILSTILLPKPPKKLRWKYIFMILQWALVPITIILLGSIPAIDAQTRLMFGKRFHLGFNVTKKVRKN